MGVFKNDVGRPSNKTIMIKTVDKVFFCDKINLKLDKTNQHEHILIWGI